MADVIHARFQDVIDTLTFDVIITDAPYGVGYAYDTYDDSTDELDAAIHDLAPFLNRAYVFTGVQNMHRWPQPHWTMAWVINAGAATGRYGFNGWQPILCYGKDPKLTDGLGRHHDVYQPRNNTRTDGRHPAEKPLSVMRWLIERVTRPGDIILDPFAGSGTTLIAAQESGRTAIGIESSLEYVKVAQSRLAQSSLGLNHDA